MDSLPMLLHHSVGHLVARSGHHSRPCNQLPQILKLAGHFSDFLDAAGMGHGGTGSAANNKNPIKVELFVNEKKVAVTKADLFRKDLMEKGIHPKGRVGFRFDLTEDQKLKKDDVVRVRAENEVKDLQNCPKVFEGVGTIEKDKEN